MDDLRSRLKEFQLDQSAVSLALGAIVVVVIGVLVFNYISRLNRPSTPIATPTTPEVSSTATQSNKHRVEAGETLGTIAQKYYGTLDAWNTICEANRAALNNNCDLVPLGAELTIPLRDVAGVTTPASSLPSPSSPSAAPDRVPASGPTPAQMPATGLSPTPTVTTYTIVRGDTLCGILTRFKGSCALASEIARCNNISNPNLIHADNVLKLSCQ